ncbi:hypothetical protein Bbelb_308930 [Branchiostoma belcheri]|nr:hypothetical protein Bbelb_308930 [Branchiostoma belcheri]
MSEESPLRATHHHNRHLRRSHDALRSHDHTQITMPLNPQLTSSALSAHTGTDKSLLGRSSRSLVCERWENLSTQLDIPRNHPEASHLTVNITIPHIEETNCNGTYIGETSQPLKERYKQHCRAHVDTHVPSTAIHNIIRDCFRLEATDILDQEPHWYKCVELRRPSTTPP